MGMDMYHWELMCEEVGETQPSEYELEEKRRAKMTKEDAFKELDYWKHKYKVEKHSHNAMRLTMLTELNESYLQTIGGMEKKIKDLEEQIRILKTIGG